MLVWQSFHTFSGGRRKSSTSLYNLTNVSGKRKGIRDIRPTEPQGSPHSTRQCNIAEENSNTTKTPGARLCHALDCPPGDTSSAGEICGNVDVALVWRGPRRAVLSLNTQSWPPSSGGGIAPFGEGGEGLFCLISCLLWFGIIGENAGERWDVQEARACTL